MKFSIIIPALNEEKYIGKCVRSVKRQLLKGDEIIVVDNGSQDKTAEIARKYGASVVNEKKKGISYARNRGAAAAKGDILCFFDADSYPSKLWIREARKVFLDPSVKAASGLSVFTHKSKAKLVWYNVYSLFAALGLLSLSLRGKLFLSANNVAIRKEVFEKLGGYEPVMGEDYWLSRKFWKLRSKKGVFNPKMIMYLSSRGFEATGYIRTIYYWTVTAMNRTSQEGYTFKNKSAKTSLKSALKS
jgi:glycosyltransferase involved in cell wall biosynthesis